MSTDYTELFKAYELAKASYSRVIDLGSSRSDAELARDRDYGDLLRAGMVIARVGGADAVTAASRYLADSTQNGDPKHFDRLWMGLGSTSNEVFN